MIKKKLGPFRVILFLVIVLIVTIGCKKEPDKVGAEIIPASGKLDVEFCDTISIVAYSSVMDSVRTDETSKSLLGSYKDPVFGKTIASFNTQFRLSGTNPGFGPNPRVDSIILALKYAGYYGDTNSLQTVHVYELSKSLDKDSTYFSNQVFPDYGFDFADYSFYPRPKTSRMIITTDTITQDSIVADTTVAPAQLRINLDRFSTQLGDKILNADSISLSDNEEFLKYFYGLAIKSEPVNNGGAILYFDLMSANSNLTIYYHNDTTDSLSFTLNINENAARFGHFDHHDYQDASPEFISQVLNKDTSLGNEVLYVQSMAGIKTEIFFPYVYDWYEKQKIVINEAQLILSGSSEPTIYGKPESLYLLKINQDGTTELMEDQFEGEEYFGGFYDSVNNNYKFRITRYIQMLMLHDFQDYGLELNITSLAVNADRLMLIGPDPGETLQDKKLKLQIKYTIVD